MEMAVEEFAPVSSDLRHVVLPSEIILFQILPRLPAKSLMRFKCVCKSWSSLIRDPFFVRAYRNMHNSQNNHTTHLLLTDGDTTHLLLTDGGAMSKPEKPKRLFSIQLINQEGMICPTTPLLLSHNWELPSSFPISCRTKASLISINFVDADGLGSVHIFNPCTREFITLPISEYDYSVPVSIVDEFNTYDIGFSTLTNEYKVLEIHAIWPGSKSPSWPDESFMFKIIILGTKTSWRDVQQETDVFADLALENVLFDKSVCIHGAIHWIQKTIEEKPVVLVFDVGEERFRVIPCPEDFKCGIYSHYWGIVEVNGCLAVYTVDLLNEMVMEFRILKDYPNQVWVKESIIFPDKWKKLGQPIPVCSIHTGELLLQQTKQTDQGYDRSVHLYDMKIKSYKKLEITVPGLIPVRNCF